MTTARGSVKTLLSTAAALIVCAAGLSSPASSQTVDSLATLLQSPRWETRWDGVVGLQRAGASSLHAGARSTLIDLLDREATQPAAEGGPNAAGEAYGEYLVDLVRLVTALNDQRALRGLTLVGIETSRAVQRWVAAQGAAALPHLFAAWDAVPGGRAAIAETWAIMLQTGTAGSGDPIRARLISGNPMYLVFASVRAPLPEAVPMLQQLAATSPRDGVRAEALAGAAVLAPQRDARSPIAILQEVDRWLAAVCVGASGNRNGACNSMRNRIDNAVNHLEHGQLNPAKSVLNSLADKADQSLGQGSISELERQLVAGNARYIISRL